MILHTDDQDFRQFATFDRPIMPRAGFTDALRQQLMSPSHAAEFTTAEGAVPMLHQVVPTIAERPWRVPRWMRAMEAAVAILVVVSLVAASFALRQPRPLYDRFSDDRIVDYGPALSPASPDAEQPLAEVNEAGDAGRTWVLGDTEPTMGAVRVDPPLAEANLGFDPGRGSRFIVGDSLFYPVPDNPAQGNDADRLIRYDLAAQREVWSIPILVTSNLVGDGTNVYGVSGSRNVNDRTGTLVAISIATGEIVWQGPRLAQQPLVPLSIVISGGTLYSADAAGNVFAVSTDDGFTVWQTQLPVASIDTPTPTSDGGTIVYVPELVVDSAWLFVTNPDQSVTRIERETGEIAGTIDVAGEAGEDVQLSLLQLRGDHLVVTAINAEAATAASNLNPETPSTILVVDAGSLDVDHRIPLDDLRGNAVLTEDTLYVPLGSGPNTPALVTPIDLATGEPGAPLDGVSALAIMFLSASGNTLMATGDPSIIGFYDLTTGAFHGSVELGIIDPESTVNNPTIGFDRPVRVWDGQPVVITPLGEVYVVTSQDSATPVASPMAGVTG